MYDLIIIGGGPSGSAAARISGKNGLKVLLLEKEVFPRYKACGGAFSEHAISYLDFDIPKHIIEREVFGARIHFRGKVIERHKNYRIATLVTRSILDEFLLEKAKETGIEIKMGEKVIDFKENRDFVEVYLRNEVYRGRFLVVAEGSKGKLKHHLRKRDEKSELGICVVGEFKEDNETIDRYIFNAIDIHFGFVLKGYGWIFPHEKYFSVGIGGTAKDLRNPIKVIEEFLHLNGFKNKKNLKVSFVPAGGIKRNIISPRVILAGDAAGFVDSFYGEGIAYAIRSGQIAGEVISDLLKNSQNSRSLKDYEERCEREFGENLRYSLVLVKLMHSFPSIFFNILTTNDEVIDKFLEVPAKRRTYKSYLQWLIPRVPQFLLKVLCRKYRK